MVPPVRPLIQSSARTDQDRFSAGIVAGPLYDRGYFHLLVTGGGIIYIISYVDPTTPALEYS